MVKFQLGRLQPTRYSLPQRRQSGLKYGGRGSGSTNFDSLNQIFEKIRFFRQFYQTISIFPGKYPKNFNFFRQFNKNFNFQVKITHLQLLLGKLFYEGLQ